MKLTYYGHSSFLVNMGGKNLLFDPFITPNELAKQINIDEIAADYIFISHGHFDHINDAVNIATRTGAKIVCNWEIYEWFNKQGLTNTHPMNIGGKWSFDSFSVKCVLAQHSSSLPDGSYGGTACGFIVDSPEGNFYYSGDTALTVDMQLIPHWSKLDFAIFPIGDNFTMGAEDAIEAARLVNVQRVIGVHYDTFGFIKIDHAKTIDQFHQAGIELSLVDIGATINL